MEKADEPAFIEAIGTLMELHGRPQSETMLNLYWEALRDLTSFQLKKAVTRAARELKFLPKPSELRELAGELSDEKVRAALCALSWEAVRGAMDKHDAYDSVDFGPLVNAVLRNLGGWQELCEKTIPELIWVRKDFERIFETLYLQPVDTLRGSYHMGTFGKPPIRIAIGNQPLPPPQLPEPPTAGSDLIRDLANAKGNS